jgi:hypothetical protein
MGAIPRLGTLCACLLVTACVQDPDWANKTALQIGAVPPEAAKIRERQTSDFPNTSEKVLLVEATQVLQDLGFTVEESAPRYGVLAGSKNRDATEAGQVASQVVLTVGLAILGVHYNPVWDTDQVIRATLCTRPAGPHDTVLRVSFERIVTDNHGLSRAEQLTEPEFSTGFFDKVRSGLAHST